MPDNMQNQAITIPDDKDLPPVPEKRQKNIPIETLIQLHAKNLSCEQIGKIVKCSRQNIQARLQASGIATLRVYSDNKDLIFEHLQQQIIKSIDDKDIKKTPMASRVTAAAILEDKIRLIRGESTENISVITAAIQDLRDKRKGTHDQEGAG